MLRLSNQLQRQKAKCRKQVNQPLHYLIANIGRNRSSKEVARNTEFYVCKRWRIKKITTSRVQPSKIENYQNNARINLNNAYSDLDIQGQMSTFCPPKSSQYQAKIMRKIWERNTNKDL